MLRILHNSPLSERVISIDKTVWPALLRMEALGRHVPTVTLQRHILVRVSQSYLRGNIFWVTTHY